jgi:large repetitive protein
LRISSTARSFCLCLALLVCASPAFAQGDVTTWQVDTKHTGVNANETLLTPSFVSTNGNLVLRYTEQVDGQVFAQPLYLSGATSSQLPGNWADGKQHKDVVFVVTEDATLYAFDADQEPNYRPNTGFSNPIWSLHLVPASNTTAVPIPQIDTDSALDIRPLFGDTATPVIDPKGGIIYVVSALKDSGTLPASHPYEQLLWAINLKSGQAVNGSPVVINPQFNGAFAGDNRTPCAQTSHVPNTPSGNGCENDNEPVAPAGTIPFYPLHSHPRSALTLENFNGHNTLYLAYASHSDGQPYSGFVVGYNATTLQQTNEFTTTPDKTFEAGIWMGGSSPAIDPTLNKMYVITGNGGNWNNKDSNNNPLPSMGVDSQGNVFSKGTNWPMSVLAFDTTPAGTVPYRGQNELQVPGADTSVWFTPAQWDSFNNGDQDLGAGGPLLFDTPAPDGSTKQLLIGGGKAGVMYVLDRTNLGGIDTSQGSTFSRNITTDFTDDNVVQEITFPNGTGFFNTPTFFNSRIYFSGGTSGARSRAVGFNQTTNTYISNTEDASPEGPVDKNAGVFISANGTSNGLVWQAANGIRVWDASNLAKGVIFSQTNIQTDDGSNNPCITPTFSLPIVSGGNVYFSCYQNPTTTGTTTPPSGTPETFVQPSDNKPGYLFVYGPAPVAPGAPIQVPLNVTAQADSESQTTVTWTDPDSGQATAHTGFNVFRATCATCVPVQIAQTFDLDFVDTGVDPVTTVSGSTTTINLTPNTTYFYMVKATNNAGSSNASNIASATTFPQYSEPGLVAYWPMDEGILQGEGANSSADLTGNGHTAVKDETDGANEIESTPSGYIGGSWQYHGTAVIDRLVVRNSSDLQFTASQSFSLVAWVNPTTLQGFSGPSSTNGFDGASMVVKLRDQGAEYGLWINLNGQWEVRSGVPGGAGTVITGPAATAGAWTQLALVQDGPNNKRYLYVKGKLAGQGTAQDASGGGDLWFGQQNLFPNGPSDQTSTDGFQGNIDEVRVYNTALTSTQLLNQFSDTVYQASSIQTHVGTPVSVPLYPFGPTGLPATEARVAPKQNYTLQLNFAQPLSTTPAVVLNAQPGSAQTVQGSVSSVTLDSTNMIVTVTLANVANAQALQMHLTGLTSEASQNASYDLPFKVLGVCRS